MARLSHSDRHSLSPSDSSDTATPFRPSASTLPNTPPPPQPCAILEYPSDVLEYTTPDLVSTPSESRPSAPSTGSANVDGPLSPDSMLAESPPSSSNFHELLSLFLAAAAVDGQASAAVETLTTAHNHPGRAPLASSDDFIVGTPCASDVASESIRTTSPRSDHSYDAQDWFDLSESSMEDNTSAPLVPSEGYLPLFDEGWDTEALEDMTSSWVVFDPTTGQDRVMSLQIGGARGKITSNSPPPVLASSQAAHVEIVANTPAVSPNSPELVSCEVDEPCDSDGPESDQEPDSLPTSNIEPMEVEEHVDNVTRGVREAMDSVMFELVTEQLFCLQAGYAHDGVIENCQAALQRLLMESGRVSASDS